MKAECQRYDRRRRLHKIFYTLITLLAEQKTKKTSFPNFIAFSEEWLQNNSPRWRESTHERYKAILRIHIWSHPYFKNRRLDQIDRQGVKKFLRQLYGYRSPATVELAHTVICSIFDEAIDNNIAVVNPTTKLLKKILPPKRKRNQKDARPFTIMERDLFLETASKYYGKAETLILQVMVHAGLRLGEALAMRLPNLDFERCAYQVKQSFKREKFTKPKTDEYRWVDLPDFLMNQLKEYSLFLKKQKLQKRIPGDRDLLFLDPDERFQRPYSQRKIQSLMRKVCNKAKLSRRSPHDLRHTYASILLMAHISPAYVQKQLGHSSINITVDTYGHWIQGEGRQGLDEALAPVRNRNENRINLHISK